MQSAELGVGGELVGDEFGGEELGDREDLTSRHSEEEGDRVESVTPDEFESEMVDSEATSNPSQETINTVNYSQSRVSDEAKRTYVETRAKTVSTLVLYEIRACSLVERRGCLQDLTSNNQTKHGSLTERLDCVGLKLG